MTDQASVHTEFSVERSRRGGTVTVRVAGELDLATVGQLEDRVAEVHPGDRLVLDLRDLSFIDSSGLRLLMTLDLRSRAEGWSLVVVRYFGAVQRVLDLCRMSERITILEDLP